MHLLEKVPGSDLCDQYGLHPTVFHEWMKTFFENAAVAFQEQKDNQTQRLEKKLSRLKRISTRKNTVIGFPGIFDWKNGSGRMASRSLQATPMRGVVVALPS